MTRKIFVPYDDRETVEKMGAIKGKTPYYTVPTNIDISLFKHWDRAELSPDIAGEDRTFGNNWLYVDLIPSSCWYTNVRSNIDLVDWERIKEMCRKRAGYLCELCGAKSDYSQRNYLECHERFLFDRDTKTQKLIRFVCLCSRCHHVTHFGLSQIQGQSGEALRHLMKVNNWNKERAGKHVEKRFEQWQIKSDMPWKLDLSMLEDMDLGIVE